MRAWQLNGVGLDQLRQVEIPAGSPGPGEILVKITAVSLNYRDWDITAGTYPVKMPLPLVIGSDAAGEVVAVGTGSPFRLGERVVGVYRPEWLDGVPSEAMLRASLGGPLSGVLSEYRVFPASGVVRAPDTLSDAEASTLPIGALTAWFALVENGRLEAGQWVALQGTGGVSLFGLQIARAFGARTVLVTSSEQKRARAVELGADAVIMRTADGTWEQEVVHATGGKGVDHILEVAGGPSVQHSVNILRRGGHIALVGYLAGKEISFSGPSFAVKHARLQGVSVGHKAAFERMLSAFETHGIHPVIEREYTFDQVRDALRHVAVGAFGKIVVRVAD